MHKRFELQNWQILLGGILIGVVITMSVLNLRQMFGMQNHEDQNEALIDDDNEFLDDIPLESTDSSQSGNMQVDQNDLTNF